MISSLLKSKVISQLNFIFPSDEPTKPGNPEITDYDNESVTLKWTPPESDGGAPIEKYILQKKDRFKQDWEPAAEIPGDQTTGVIPNLKEKEELQFRVVAVNKAGPSEASEPTKIHIVKHKSCKYRVLYFYSSPEFLRHEVMIGSRE